MSADAPILAQVLAGVQDLQRRTGENNGLIAGLKGQQQELRSELAGLRQSMNERQQQTTRELERVTKMFDDDGLLTREFRLVRERVASVEARVTACPHHEEPEPDVHPQARRGLRVLVRRVLFIIGSLFAGGAWFASDDGDAKQIRAKK